MSETIKIVALSDTHCVYQDIPPPGDILLIAGDVLWNGDIKEYGIFWNWLESIRPNYTFCVFVPGNHDIYVEDNEFMVKGDLKHKLNVDTLIDQTITYVFDGHKPFSYHGKKDSVLLEPGVKEITIHGAPWIPLIGKEKYWAYELPRGDRLAERWEMIPGDLDILVTHGPPKDMLDHIMKSYGESEHWGCWDLKRKLNTMLNPPSHHVYGHIHDPVQGKEKIDLLTRIHYHNVAVCDENYMAVFEPKVFEI
jgi:Icc-related predicted phosphoesterase